MDSKSMRVAVSGDGYASNLEKVKDADKYELSEAVKVEAASMYGQMPVLDKSTLDAESDRDEYRSAKDAKSQRQLNELYTGKHRASTMYGITKGHKSNTGFKANRNKNFQRTKH